MPALLSNPFVLAFLTGIACAALGWVGRMAWSWRRARRRVWDLTVRGFDVFPGASQVAPRVLLATFSGYFQPREMSKDDFQQALKTGDIEVLEMNQETPGIGHLLTLLETYPGLEQLYLITTRSKQGSGSHESVELVRAYIEAKARACDVFAPDELRLLVEEEHNLIERSYDTTRALLKKLYRDFRPSEVLVDLTGGPRSIGTGALLACLQPQQEVSLVGSRYDVNGKRLPKTAYPVTVNFGPNWLS